MQAYKYFKYNHSVKGKARNIIHGATEARGKSYQEFYAKHGGEAAYQRERYHKIQDETGCYMAIRDFSTGFRILKALEAAEVVKI